MRVFLPFFLLSISCLAQDVDRLLVWDANPEPDLMEYRLYVGTNDTDYGPPIKVLTNSKVLSLPKVLHWAKVTAVNTSGLESLPSNVLIFQVFATGEEMAPSAPVGLRLGGPLQVSLEQSQDLKTWTPMFSQVVQSFPQDFFRVKLEAR